MTRIDGRVIGAGVPGGDTAGEGALRSGRTRWGALTIATGH